ncbi:MAG TPA: bifunctional DNA-binding transcriptional regulator/O6-methylguanine-DNA methyltransferase Ada [Geobacteraceae bacterium]
MVIRQMKQSTDAQGSVSFPNEEVCWDAVVRRDAAFDGIFWSGVRTTGIFCRPSCASRLPRRENVLFFPLPELAIMAGMRPCRRCHPEKAALLNPQAEMVRRVCRLLDESVGENPDLAFLSRQLKVGQSHLQRIFKGLTGISPRQYLEARRMDLFRAGVKSGQSVTEAMYDAGYGSSSRLYEKAAGRLGMTPAVYGKGGRGMKMTYTFVENSLGYLLVAATDRGICSVMLGDEQESLANELRQEFPGAEIRRDDDRLRSQVATLLDCLAGQAPNEALPLDVQGTAFQMRVWEELRRIPRGSTASYGELAERIGRPKAVRAVGRACATNPVALITPCHRAVRANGELGGYRWGIERKRRLLEEEKKG